MHEPDEINEDTLFFLIKQAVAGLPEAQELETKYKLLALKVQELENRIDRIAAITNTGYSGKYIEDFVFEATRQISEIRVEVHKKSLLTRLWDKISGNG